MRNISKLIGPVIWLAAWLCLRLPLEVAILLFAPLVLVPHGLALIDDSKHGVKAFSVLNWTKRLLLPAAIALAFSFAFEQGRLAAALASPWLGITLLLAAAGIHRLIGNGFRVDAATAEAAALLFIPVGGAWALISRAGLRPQDFSHAIVLLTAVHFHYAGFLLPLIAACTARAHKPEAQARGPVADTDEQSFPINQLHRLDRVMLIGIIFGVPAVGIGISLSPHIEVAAAMGLALACAILAIRQIQAALTSGNATQVTLALVSSLSLLAAMSLAGVYALGEFTGQRWLEIPTMIRTHGAFNAFGFAACGIAAWSRVTIRGANVGSAQVELAVLGPEGRQEVAPTVRSGMNG